MSTLVVFADSVVAVIKIHSDTGMKTKLNCFTRQDLNGMKKSVQISITFSEKAYQNDVESVAFNSYFSTECYLFSFIVLTN